MEEMIQAYETLMNGFTDVLEEMVDDGKISTLSIMGASVGTPEFPFLEANCGEPWICIEDTGLSETWEGDVILSSQVLNNQNPNEGIHKATSLISEVKNKIIKSRRLKDIGLDYIKSKDFGWVPYALGKQKNIYSAGVTFTIRFKIINPGCK